MECVLFDVEGVKIADKLRRRKGDVCDVQATIKMEGLEYDIHMYNW